MPAEHAGELTALAAEDQQCRPPPLEEVRAPTDGANLLTDLFVAT